jgi:hypothetical protein
VTAQGLPNPAVQFAQHVRRELAVGIAEIPEFGKTIGSLGAAEDRTSVLQDLPGLGIGRCGKSQKIVMRIVAPGPQALIDRLIEGRGNAGTLRMDVVTLQESSHAVSPVSRSTRTSTIKPSVALKSPTMTQKERVPAQAVWERAFHWLAANELGIDSDLVIPDDEHCLRQRTKTLAILFDLLPRMDVERLPELIAAWAEHFGDQATVPLAPLKRVARGILTRRADPKSTDDLWQRAVQFSRGPSDAAVVIPESTERPEASIAGQRQCAEGLLRWFQELQLNPEWNTLPGALPGDADRPLSEVYVELLAIEESEVTQPDDAESGKRASRREQGIPAIGVETMIARTLERCVVVGDPGSGKSTLVKWLVWATFREQLPDFDIAIEIKLSAFAAALADDPHVTPLEFFFRSRGQDAPAARMAASALRGAARETQRYLLLLDGWDEVPVALRGAVKEQLLGEDRALLTFITSRPSGMPRQLLDGQRVGCYRIAGLTPAMAEELTTRLLRQLGQSHHAATIWGRIRDDLQLRDMTANPFLLGLLVRTLIEPGRERVVTRATVYRRLVSSIREHHDHACRHTDTLTAKHLVSLAQLSFWLLNDPQTPRYLFARRELETSLDGLKAEPVLRSRFVTKPVSVLDEFVFLHATIQEFLAAEYLADGTASDQHMFMDRAFHSASRLIVLEFFAGLGGEATQRCQEAARGWWQSPDRFLQVAIRMAGLAAAGCWPVDDLGRSLRNALWAEISKEKDEDLKLCKAAVDAHAALDAVDLIRRALHKPPSGWAINCLMDAIPAPLAREYRLDQLLEGEWRDVAGLAWMGGATEDERTHLLQRLSDWDSPAADLREAVLQVGGSQDESAIPLLIAIVNGDTLPERVREEAVTSLGRIGGKAAVQALLDILLNRPDDETLARMSATAFLTPSSRRICLDPCGRDRLLRRLAAMPAASINAKYLLMVLDTIPIRDGAEVIAELATSSAATLEVQQQAIAVLKCVTDRRLLERLTNKIDERPPELKLMWLNLAWERSLPLPLAWLKRQLNRSRNRIEREQLLRVLLQVLARSDAATIVQERPFLQALVANALHPEPAKEELARMMFAAIGEIADTRVILFSEQTRSLALQVLANPQSVVGKQQVLLAVVLIRHFRDTVAARGLLVGLLEPLCHGRSYEDSGDYQIAMEIGDCLSELAPDELLRLPPDGLGVVWALRSRSLNEGWMVYSDRILNAEGHVIASLHAAKSPVAFAGQTVELQTLLAKLSPQARNALESYCLMVGPGGPCHSGDSYPQVHRIAQAMCDRETEETEIGRMLSARFPSGFPQLLAWTKQLNRIETKFAGKPEAETLLRSLGLYRR